MLVLDVIAQKDTFKNWGLKRDSNVRTKPQKNVSFKKRVIRKRFSNVRTKPQKNVSFKKRVIQKDFGVGFDPSFWRWFRDILPLIP